MPADFPPDLLPLVTTEDDREALLVDAFYSLSDSRIYHQIKRDGSPVGFTTLCIKRLLDYGCLTEGQHALGQLLQTAKYYCGVDKHATINELVSLANDPCNDLTTTPPTDTPATTSTSPVTTPTQTIATPRDERTPTVFISYSHKDDAFAKRLIADLNAAGHACWIDTVKIKGGDEWIQSITEGINNSYAFVSLISPDANRSIWVRREVLWAEHKKKRIVPVMARESELTIYLMERQVIGMHADYNSGPADLLSVLPAPRLPRDADESDTAKETAEAILQPRKVSRRQLEQDYLEKLRAEVLFDLEKYTPLGGESQFIVQVQRGNDLELAHMRPEFEHLKRRDHAQDEHEIRRFDNAVDEILKIERAVLLGEPGAGKITTLLSLAGELADTAQNDPKAPLPIFVRLGRWTDEEQPLMAFIAEEMGDLGAYLSDLIDEGRAVPLLDGMNEIPVSQRKTKYKAIRDFITRYPDWIAVASCRKQDYTVDLQLDRITVTPLDPLRIREFVVRYLGEERGESLFWKIAGEAAKRFEVRFRDLFADRLDDWRETFWLAANLPDDLEWKREFVDTYYYGWQEWREIRDAPGSLLQLARNPYMLSMLTQVYIERGDLPPNRGELFGEFVNTLLLREELAWINEDDACIPGVGNPSFVITDEGYDLLEALREVAYRMQIERGTQDEGNAVTALPVAEVEDVSGKRLLYLAASTNILDIDDEVRFTHQLLQEFFAAQYLNAQIFGAPRPGKAHAKGEPLQASDIWTAPEWWERTNWEEAVILLAGLYSDDCSRVVEWVNEANPEVAAMCVARSGAALADETQQKLRTEWLNRLTDIDNEPNLYARAAIGRALGLTNWDDRPGVNVIVRDGVPLPDIEWVTIPAGEFTYQDRTMTLDYDFKIARYPVTYAQFQTFIDDPDGFYDPRWWDGLALPDDHNNAPGDQAFKYWNHPRERVSWYDAIAFCRWLSWRMGGWL